MLNNSNVAPKRLHTWEPTDNQGYSMVCTTCHIEISYYDKSWNQIDGKCRGKPIPEILLLVCRFLELEII